MPSRTLQMAMLGGDEGAVLVGLRSFPAHKLTLICSNESLSQADKLSTELRGKLRLEVDIVQIKDAAMGTVLETVGRIINDESSNFQDFVMNVGCASKYLTSAGVSAAFVHGVKAFDVAGDQVIELPIMRFSYAQAITEPKLKILLAIEGSGGEVESLEKLTKLMSFGKPLLSYHIRGSERADGLEKLGLVEVERGKRGRLRVKVTPLGRTLLATSIKQSI